MPTAMTFTSLLADLRSYLERGQAADASVYAQLPQIVNTTERQIATELKVEGFIVSVTANFQANVAVYAKPNRWRKTVSINYGTGNDQITSVTVTNGGAGYLAPPRVTFTGGGGSGAQATAVITDGVVTSIQVAAPGAGYTSVPTVVIAGGDGLLAAGTAVVGSANNKRNFVLPRSYEYVRTFWPDDTISDGNKPPKFYSDYDAEHILIAPTPAYAYPFEMLYWEQPPLLDETTQTNWLTEYAPNALLYGSLLTATPYLNDDARIATWQTFYDRTMQGLSGEDISKMIDRAQKRKEA